MLLTQFGLPLPPCFSDLGRDCAALSLAGCSDTLSTLTPAAQPNASAAWDAECRHVICRSRCCFFFVRHTAPLSFLRCATFLLKRLCTHHLHRGSAAVKHLQYPCTCTSARKLSHYRERHFADALDVHHRQSVLLRLHKRPLSTTSVMTAHRVCGKWPWLFLWPALTSPLAPGCGWRITVLGLVFKRSAFLRPGSGTPR